MSISRILDIAGSALRAQSTRLNAVASNLANAETAAAPGEAPYRARQVVFSAEAIKAADGATPGANAAAGVKVAEVREDQSPARRQYDPNHPYADAEGYVTLNNVNAVDEMVNMISASRSYQNNAEVINTAKNLFAKTIQLGS